MSKRTTKTKIPCNKRDASSRSHTFIMPTMFCRFKEIIYLYVWGVWGFGEGVHKEITIDQRLLVLNEVAQGHKQIREERRVA